LQLPLVIAVELQRFSLNTYSRCAPADIFIINVFNNRNSVLCNSNDDADDYMNMIILIDVDDYIEYAQC